MSWLYYLLEANLYLILFFAFYYLVLRRETWYQYNRAYLLATSALAFIIPFVQLGMLKPTPVAPAGQLRVTQIYYDTVSVARPIVTATSWTKEDYYLAAYLLIACCLLINLAIKIYKLIRLSRLNSSKTTDKWKIIETDKNKGAFSFFSYLFVSPEMALSETVIAHELVHIRQKHSWDIIYFELIKVVSWFNPIAYLLQHSIKELHEFIADSEIAGNAENINKYTDFLLGNAYGIHESQLTNNLFNKSLLKKRIMMLHQKRSGNSARLKYLLVLPLSVGLLCTSTLAFAKNYGWIDLAPKHAPSEKTLTPNINSANKIKRLKVTQGSISMITDKISVRESKSRTGVYTAATLTIADKVRLQKNYNIKVEIVEADNPVTQQEMSFPINIRPDLHKVPPPPPAEVIVNNKINGVIKTKTGKAHTILYEPKTGATGAATPLVIVNGVKYVLPEKLKPGQYLYTHATDSTIQTQPGNAYAIQKWGEEAKNGVLQLFGKTSVEVIQGKNDTTNKLSKEVTSQISSTINKEVKKQIDKATIITDTAMQAFYQQIGRTTHYPAAARDNKVTGRVFAVFNVDGNNNIINVGVLRSPDKVMSQEVVRALKNCSGKFKGQTDVTYTIPVSFNIQNEQTGKYLDTPVTAPNQDAVIQRDQSIKTQKNIYLNEVVIVSFVKQQ